MKAFIRKYEIWLFLGIIVAFNTIFVAAIASEVLPRGLYNYGRFALLGALLFAFVFLVHRWNGVVGLLRPLAVWKLPVKWYLLALIWAPLNCVVLLLGKGILTGNGTDEIAASFSLVSRPSIMAVIVVSSLIGEIVWISYAVRRFSERVSYYAAGLLVGVFWTMWWTPIVLYNIGVAPDLPLAGLLLNQTGVALMCAFFYAQTKSGISILVMQVVFNNCIFIFPVLPTTGGVGTYWAFGIVYFLSATGLFLMFGPRPLFSAVANSFRRQKPL